MNNGEPLSDSIAFREIVRDTFKDDSRVVAVYLHGSVASGTMRPDSDVDLAILVRAKATVSVLERQRLANQLSYRLRRRVDLGEISSRNLVFAAEVLFHGQRLFAFDPDAAALRSATLLGLYLQLNHDRREIIEAYRA